MAALWLLIKGWHQSAAAVSGVTIVVFAYGHVDRALDGRLDDHVLFPIAAVVAVLVCLDSCLDYHASVTQLAPFLNITLGTLLLFQIIDFPDTGRIPNDREHTSTVCHQLLAIAVSYRPDIYYIVLDAYGRHDTLDGFDNTPFLSELQQRGFYVAADATSNYRDTIQSLASSLNLAYLQDLQPMVPKTPSDGISLVQNNALVTTLHTLGYTYVHLESGSVITNRAPTADILVSFTPAGVIVTSDEQITRHSPLVRASQDEGIRHSSFIRSLINTTALRPLTGHRFRPGDESPYDWWAPERTLRMFEFLSNPIETTGPKFVFAHILKPHPPATFDRHGNMLISHRVEDEFSDAHDATVPNAYIGQTIYINSLVLRTVDRILERYIEKPIIVIAADHAREGPDKHAYFGRISFSTEGGSTVLYPSISSVNHFRSMLDYYFGFNLGLLGRYPA